MQPSAFGYNTTKPMHREARQMVHDRDRREKTRVEGVVPLNTNPLHVPKNSASYADNTERLRTDVSNTLTGQEKQSKAHKQNSVNTLKNQRQQREDNRWTTMEKEHAKKEQDAKLIAGTGLRNKGSVGYNLINGSWGSSEDAAKAKFRDDCVEFAAKSRSKKLDSRGNSGAFNVITGEPRVSVNVPPTPKMQPQ